MAEQHCGLKPASFSLYDDCKNDKEFQRLIKKYYGIINRELIIVIIAVIIVLTFISTRLLLKEREEDYMENKETFAPWFG